MFQEKLLKKALAAYAGEHVLQRVLEKGEDALRLGGQIATLTLYFQDIAGFTSVTEHLDPEKLARLLYEYLTVMTQTVEYHKGVVLQYVGEAIMAFWGGKGELDHADSACSCALAAVRQASILSQGWNLDGQALKPIVGINTGRVILGNFGSPSRFQFTVFGDAVNLASRLEGGNKDYGTSILLSEFTRQALVGHADVREVDSIHVNGINHPVKLYTFDNENSQ